MLKMISQDKLIEDLRKKHIVDTWIQSDEYVNSRIQGEEGDVNDDDDEDDDVGKLGDSVEEGAGLFKVQFSLIGFSANNKNTLIMQKM